MALRARASEESLAWLDAAVVLSGGEPAYPPLLGTGGNDGRLDFTNNFMQRLVDLFDPATGTATDIASPWLEHALYARPTPNLAQKAIGQFAPGQVGGANATSGFSAESLMNPWVFVLMLEGALLFITATSRRLESNQQARLAYPFTVYANSSGSGALAQADAGVGSSHGEIWMPLWERPAGFGEIAALMAEGRATLGRRAARDGLDFARAVGRLGTDRGVSSFQRFGFMARNGRTFLATPLARVESTRAPEAGLINDLERDNFLDLLRREAPPSLKRAVAQLENALFALTSPGAGRLAIQRALILLGEVMQTLAVSRKGQEAVPVIPSLSAAWVLNANDDSAEFRIALALASLPGMTAHVAPVEWSTATSRWQWQPQSRLHVWGKGSLTRNLVCVAERRMVEAQRRDGAAEPFASYAALGARRTEIHRFLSEQTNDTKITGLLQALVWAQLPEALPQPPVGGTVETAGRPAPLSVVYRIFKPLFASSSLLRTLNRLPEDARWALPQEIPRLLTTDRVGKALEIAWRRSRIAGLGWPVGTCPEAAEAKGPRLLATLTIPVQPADLARLLPRMEDHESKAA